ncbi:hypothetical protein AOC36_10475 [Erysipelothrix larvae]|uniref:N-acetyltransferase domain-containing protein n=1 Tax=Erysipelothrix larvae TaxID=1514105 RepID=A0A109UHL3_9FIRM|nr:GNAT family N-acetyltransferase [Erysipelothrix larvae]AMC94381.1 hypothetical protein AOC36_10475 [Erysipelothrix larvae]
MIFRKAVIEDVFEIDKIIEDAKLRLKEMGIDQWQNGYPNRESTVSDISNETLYVLCDDHHIVAITTVIKTLEPCYRSIDGAWGSEGDYLTLHRVATAQNRVNNGVGTHLFEAIQSLYPNTTIRIDTHRENLPMKRLLEKCGFVYRGIILLEDGAPRDAFDWIPH